MEKRLLKVKDMCSLLECKRNTLYKLIYHHSIPDKAIRFDPDAIKKWLQGKPKTGGDNW